MNTLFLDLASHSTRPQEGASVACVSADATESIRFIDHRIGDDGIIPVISDALGAAGWTEKDIGQIACVIGPGGFTSLRMAVTMANVYGDQLNLPVAGVHLSDLYATRSVQKDFIWIHATKKVELFVRGFGKYASLSPEAVLTGLDELVERYPEGAPFAGELLAEQREKLTAKNIAEAELMPLGDALPGFLKTQSFERRTLQPWYGRGW